MNTRATQGWQIVDDLLADGIDEWIEISEDVLPDSFYAVKTERDFANSIIMRLTDDDEATAELIVTLLVRSVCAAVESFISGWDDKMLADVPAFVVGIAKAKAWLEERED